MYEEHNEFPLTYKALWDGRSAMPRICGRRRCSRADGGDHAADLQGVPVSFYGVLLAGGVPVPLYPPRG
jgi:hypothetical protein